jgi:hypothetical protein
VTGTLVSAGASSVAHGVHYTVLGIGLLGLVILLAPWGTPAGRHTSSPDSGHARRVAALRRSAHAGTLGSFAGVVVAERPTPDRRTTTGSQLWLPLAVVSTAAAAGVHVAVGPAHFREQTLLGLFFAASALAQIGWSLAMVGLRSVEFVRAGATLNLGLIVLWLITRTIGLPGVLAGPEAVGAWDLACVTWEATAVLACVRVLGTGTSYRLAPWVRWDRRVRAWALVSAVGLGLLSISGAGA